MSMVYLCVIDTTFHRTSMYRFLALRTTELHRLQKIHMPLSDKNPPDPTGYHG